MRWIVSGSAALPRTRGNVTNNYINNMPFIVEASSRDEAHGKAMRVMYIKFPQCDGWKDHNVNPHPLQDGHVDPDLPGIDPVDASLFPYPQ